MKKLLFLIVIIVLVSSCRKEGPPGPDGKTGTTGAIGSTGANGDNGANGADGKNGIDASTCKQCHDVSTRIYAAQLQYEKSFHSLGENTGYANQVACAGCHNNEGFNQRMADGVVTTISSNVTPISCYTCHSPHKNYDSTDLALKTIAPVTLITDASITLDFGNANLCINCHQSRAHGIAELSSTSTANVSITARFGPHHGPQGNLIAGVGKSGAFEIGDPTSYSNSSHASIPNECITCHMGSSANSFAVGGHSLNITYDSHGTETLNLAACKSYSCHSSSSTAASLGTKLENSQANIQTYLDSIQTNIVDRGWYDAANSVFKVPLTVTADQARALYNFKFIQEDRSLGIHNPAYASTLLINSFEVLKQ